MECKFLSLLAAHKDVSRINRYIMECKLSLGKVAKNLSNELIDTLWNVNCVAGNPCVAVNPELIDTLWNVNTYMLMMSDARTSN